MQHGYDPSRITTLALQSRWAAGALDGITSTDPAASDAMTAVAILKSIVVDGFIPAATTVAVVDPLGHSDRDSVALTGTDWYSDWLSSVVVTAYSAMSDDELFAELDRLEDELPYDENLEPDMDDPFWIGFEELATEMSLRAEADDSFAARLAREAGTSVLIPVAVGFARFAPEVVVSMLETVTYSRQTLIDVEYYYQAYGVDRMLDFLAGYPALALEMLANSPTDLGDSPIRELITWPTIDHALVTTFIDVAMTAPFQTPELLEQAGWVLQDLVVLANQKGAFPDGFPADVSPTLAKILIQYLPFFVTSLDGERDVMLKNFDLDDFGLELGTYEEMLDLFGAAMRDPASLTVLLAAIPMLTSMGIESERGVDIHLGDVAEYVEFLKQAAANEQLEEQLEAQRDHDGLEFITSLVFGAMETIADVVGPITFKGIEIPLAAVEKGASLMIDWATGTTDLGFDDIDRTAYLLTVYGLAVAMLQTIDDDGIDTERVETIVAEIDEAVDAGASLDDVDGRITDLERELEFLGIDHTTILQGDKVRPGEHVVDETTTDTER